MNIRRFGRLLAVAAAVVLASGTSGNALAAPRLAAIMPWQPADCASGGFTGFTPGAQASLTGAVIACGAWSPDANFTIAVYAPALDVLHVLTPPTYGPTGHRDFALDIGPVIEEGDLEFCVWRAQNSPLDCITVGMAGFHAVSATRFSDGGSLWVQGLP